MNTENFKKVLDQITNHPETWDQSWQHYNSIHSFLGWAQILAGKEIVDGMVRPDACEFLDIDNKNARYLGGMRRTLTNYRYFLKFHEDFPSGFDNEGYDYVGYKRDGYDRTGYDSEGYDRNGIDYYGYTNSERVEIDGQYHYPIN